MQNRSITTPRCRIFFQTALHIPGIPGGRRVKAREAQSPDEDQRLGIREETFPLSWKQCITSFSQRKIPCAFAYSISLIVPANAPFVEETPLVLSRFRQCKCCSILASNRIFIKILKRFHPILAWIRMSLQPSEALQSQSRRLPTPFVFLRTSSRGILPLI